MYLKLINTTLWLELKISLTTITHYIQSKPLYILDPYDMAVVKLLAGLL